MFDRVLGKLLKSSTEWKYQRWSFSCVILSCLEKCYENQFGSNWLGHWNSDATWTWSERFKEFVPSQHFNVLSTLLQRCVNVERTLIRRWKWNKIWHLILSLLNVDTTPLSERALHNVILMLIQRWYIISTLFQRGFNVN